MRVIFKAFRRLPFVEHLHTRTSLSLDLFQFKLNSVHPKPPVQCLFVHQVLVLCDNKSS